MVLAYDEKELFDSTAQLFFRNVQTPYPFLKSGQKVFEMQHVDIADAIAFIHLLHFPVKDPAHMKAALDHFEATGRREELLRLAAAFSPLWGIRGSMNEGRTPRMRSSKRLVLTLYRLTISGRLRSAPPGTGSRAGQSDGRFIA